MELEKFPPPKQVALNDKSMVVKDPSLRDSLMDKLMKVLFTIGFGLFLLILFILTGGFNELTHIARLDIRFDSASFTLLNANGTISPILNAKSNINFIIANPSNTYNISCNTINATLFYGGSAIAITRLPPFLQLNRSETKLPVQLNLVDQFLDNNIVAQYTHRSIEFGLELFLEISRGVDDNSFIDKFFAPKFADRGAHHNTLRFYCRSLRFVFKSDNSTFASGSCLSHPSLFSQF